MKKLIPLLPLLLVLGGCTAAAATRTSDPHSAPILSRSASLDDIPLRLDVAGLHRQGRTATLALRLSNRAPRGGDAFEISDTFSRDDNADLGGILLVDTSTGHELAALEEDIDLYSVAVAPDGSQTLSVSFPAPTGKSVDLLVPHFGLYRDVPVR
jgi:hypothetical protein